MIKEKKGVFSGYVTVRMLASTVKRRGAAAVVDDAEMLADFLGISYQDFKSSFF
jgi:hypothetical protein